MSLSEARKAGDETQRSPLGRRAVVRLLASSIAVGVLTAGCGNGGFRPLYGSATLGGGEASTKLSQIEFAPIPGRVGQQIRNELIFQATGGGGETKEPAYRLEVAITESTTQTLTKIDGTSLSSIFSIDATFKLLRTSDKKVMLSGKSFGRASFERVQSVYANVEAKKNAEDRAAKAVAEELKVRLAAFLASPPA